MADDFSWIAPATKNIANLFGLNPEVAAKGRNMQADYDYTVARTANTQADTALSPYRQKVLEAQAAERAAMGGKHNADTRYRDTETQGLAEQQSQLRILQGLINKNFTIDADGRPVPKPGTLGETMAAAIGAGGIKNVANSGKVIGDYGLIAAPSSREANLAAGGANATAAGKPSWAGTNEQAQAYNEQQAAAEQAKAVEVAKARGIAASIANGGQPRAMDLTRAANDAVKIGPEYIQNRYPQSGMSLTGGSTKFPIPEEVALEITAQAQRKYPHLPINQAIDNLISESGITFDTRGNWNPFMANETWPYAKQNPQSDPERLDGSPGLTVADVIARSAAPAKTAPVAPAKPAAPVAPAARSTAPASSNGVSMSSMESVPGQPAAPAARSTVPDSHKGAPMERMVSTPGQPAATAAKPAQGEAFTREKAEAMPEGSSVVLNGVTYVKRGRQLVKAQ